MKLIIPIYIISIGNWLVGLFALWLDSITHKPITDALLYSAIGIVGLFIAKALSQQHKRIEKLESHEEQT